MVSLARDKLVWIRLHINCLKILASLDTKSFTVSLSNLFAVNVDEWLQSASAENGDCEDIADDQGSFSFILLTSSAVKL